MNRRLQIAYLVALAVLLGVAFGPHLRGEWVWDDTYLVHENPNLKNGTAGLHVLVTHDLWGSAGLRPTDLYHPVPMAMIWLVSAVGGQSVVVLRVVNLLLHAGCIFLFASWMRRRGLPTLGALFVSLLVAMHPLVTEPVMWITGSHDLLAVLGCLTALVVWPIGDDGHRRARIVVATVATAWAALSKEPYFVFPAILLVAALVTAHRERAPKRVVEAVAPFGAVFLVVGLRAYLHIPTGSSQVNATLGTHLVDFATILLHYFEHIITFDAAPTTERFAPLSGAMAGLVWVGVVAISGLVAWRYRKATKGSEVALIGWCWFLIALAPHTIATPLIGMYGNRYAYFPMMGLAASILGLATPLAPRFVVAPLRPLRWLAPVAVLALLPLTAAAAVPWQDELALFGADVDREPENPRALYHYGHAVRVKSGCEAALPFFIHSTEREPTYGRAWHNVAGCLVDLHRYAEALPAATTAFKLQPDDPGTVFNLAVATLATGDEPSARALLQEALRLDPKHPAATRLLAQLSLHEGREHEAPQHEAPQPDAPQPDAPQP